MIDFQNQYFISLNYSFKKKIFKLKLNIINFLKIY
jgi:hypothetical protein